MLIMPIVFSVFFLFFPVRPGAVLGRAEPAVDPAAVAHQPHARARSGSEGQGPALSRGGETIAAIATPAGRGGIGVVRVSGAARGPIASRRSRRAAARARGGATRPFRDAERRARSTRASRSFPAPHSYTGEDVLELQGHGGPVVMRRLLAALRRAGRAHGASPASSRGAPSSTAGSTSRRPRASRTSSTPRAWRPRAARRVRSRASSRARSRALVDADRAAHARRGVASIFPRRRSIPPSRAMRSAEARSDPRQSLDAVLAARAGRGAARRAHGRPHRRAERRQVEPAQPPRRRRASRS